jgi:hypothetical protein
MHPLTSNSDRKVGVGLSLETYYLKNNIEYLEMMKCDGLGVTKSAVVCVMI